MKGDLGPATWFVGTQLVGVVFLLAGWIQRTWPPKAINSFYGYRTSRSMKNQQTWDEGNRYSAALMIKAGILLVILGLAVSAVMNSVPTDGHTKGMIIALSGAGGGIGSAIVMIAMTENHLKKLDGNDV